MNCREARLQIMQFADGVVADEVQVHARDCAACGRILEETQRQQFWLRGQFDRASRQLIEQAPPFSMAAIRQHGMQEAERPPVFRWALAAAAVLALAATGWWQWSHPSAIPAPAPLANAEPEREPVQPPQIPAPAPQPKRPALAQSATEPSRSLPPPIPPPAPLFSNVAGTVPLPQRSAPPRVESHVFAMEPTDAAPNAGGYMVALLPEDAGEFSPTMFVLSLTGLEPDSVYFVTVGGAAGERVQLASVKTDAHGSAAVMLQGKADDTPAAASTAAGSQAIPAPRIADASPSVTLDGTGPTVTLSGPPSTTAPGILSMRTSVAPENLPVVTDALGNPVMTVNPVSTKNP